MIRRAVIFRSWVRCLHCRNRIVYNWWKPISTLFGSSGLGTLIAPALLYFHCGLFNGCQMFYCAFNFFLFLRILRNSSRELVDSDAITYYLYMRSGFENLCINDRVFVTVPPSIPTVGGKKSKKRHMNKYQNALLMAYDSKEAYFDDQCRRYPAEITKARWVCCFIIATYWIHISSWMQYGYLHWT